MIPRRPIPLLAALAALGCGDGETPTSPPGPPGPVAVAKQEGTEQAETAVVIARAGGAPTVVVAFNDYTLDSAFPGGPEYSLLDDGEHIQVRRGSSLMGWSVSRDGGLSYEYRGKVRPPPGWAVIWGDPSLAVDPSAPGTVYLADLAISDASWDNGSAGADTLVDPQTYSDGVCVARSIDGGISFPEIACVSRPPETLDLCHPGPSVCVDHTALGVDGKGRLYLATEVFHHDGNGGAILHVYRSPSSAAWNALAPVDPQPPTVMEIEPAIAVDPNGDVWIAGATLGTTPDVGINRQIAGAEGWTSNGYVMASAGIDTYTGGLDDRLHTAPDTMFRVGRTFALAAGARDGRAALAIVFSALRADKTFGLGAVHCAPGLSPDSPCVHEPAWETATLPGQQFMPSLAVSAADPARFEVAFLTDDAAPARAGTIQIAARALSFSKEEGARVAREARLTPADWPVCARQSAADPSSNYNGYWGDYLGTAAGIDASGLSFSVTAYSDSRPAGSCRRENRFADPLHVAATRW